MHFQIKIINLKIIKKLKLKNSLNYRFVIITFFDKGKSNNRLIILNKISYIKI